MQCDRRNESLQRSHCSEISCNCSLVTCTAFTSSFVAKTAILTTFETVQGFGNLFLFPQKDFPAPQECPGQPRRNYFASIDVFWMMSGHFGYGAITIHQMAFRGRKRMFPKMLNERLSRGRAGWIVSLSRLLAGSVLWVTVVSLPSRNFAKRLTGNANFQVVTGPNKTSHLFCIRSISTTFCEKNAKQVLVLSWVQRHLACIVSFCASWLEA
jgi:hypothetical protein